MRFFVAAFIIGVTLIFGIQTVSLFRERARVAARLDETTAQAQALMQEEKKLEDDLRYITQPEARTRELQSKMNYRKADEELFILIPGQGE